MFDIVKNIRREIHGNFSKILLLFLPCIMIIYSTFIHKCILQWFSKISSPDKLDITSVLFLATGISNLVALLDINEELIIEHKEKKHKGLFSIYFLQIVVLAVFISFILSLFFSEINFNNQDEYLMYILFAGVISTTVGLYLVFHKKAKVSKYGCYIIFLGVICCLAPLWVIGFLLPKLTKHGGVQLNLLAYPIFYFVSDSIIFFIIKKKQFKLETFLASTLPLDMAILLVSFTAYTAGIKIKDPLFFAGSSAAILILGNCFYVIHKYRTQSNIGHNQTK